MTQWLRSFHIFPPIGESFDMSGVSSESYGINRWSRPSGLTVGRGHWVCLGCPTHQQQRSAGEYLAGACFREKANLLSDNLDKKSGYHDENGRISEQVDDRSGGFQQLLPCLEPMEPFVSSTPTTEHRQHPFPPTGRQHQDLMTIVDFQLIHLPFAKATGDR